MYEPAIRPANLLYLWPALAAAANSDFSALLARQLVDLALGEETAKAAAEQSWTTLNAVALDLGTVRLRDFSRGETREPALICTPLALHGATIADLAPGHSLVAALRGFGVGHLFVTDWRSATQSMRYLGVDDYLADFNVLVDQIGPPVDLIGLCQGGWMTLVYAARFPGKVRKLVVAGAPVDTAIAHSALSLLAQNTPLAVFRGLVCAGSGLLSGRRALKYWGPDAISDESIRDCLQTDDPVDSVGFAELRERFQRWYSWTLDLPGAYFLDVVEKLYKRNAIASGEFVALGRKIDLKTLAAPLYLLAARDDELVTPAQLFAAEQLMDAWPGQVCKVVMPGRHLSLFAGKTALQKQWCDVAQWLRQHVQARRLQ